MIHQQCYLTAVLPRQYNHLDGSCKLIYFKPLEESILTKFRIGIILIISAINMFCFSILYLIYNFFLSFHFFFFMNSLFPIYEYVFYTYSVLIFVEMHIPTYKVIFKNKTPYSAISLWKFPWFQRSKMRERGKIADF